MADIFTHMQAHGSNRYLFGQRIGQNYCSLFVMEQLLRRYKPDAIAELGTGRGTMAAYFSVYAVFSEHKVEVVTVDLNNTARKMRELTIVSGGRTRAACDNFHAPEQVSHLTGLLNRAERPFLLIDGADPKSAEANLYGARLKKDVPVFIHDANLPGCRHVAWGFNMRSIDWKLFEKFEPYYSWSIQADTRMLCVKTKEAINHGVN
jgi:hypothetical protein